MDLLQGYSSNSDDNDSDIDESNKKKTGISSIPLKPFARRSRNPLNAAPIPQHNAIVTIRSLIEKRNNNNDDGTLAIAVGEGEPIQGPSSMDPFGPKPESRGDIGKKETNVYFDELDFRKQKSLFERTGQALAPYSDETTETEQQAQAHINNTGMIPYHHDANQTSSSLTTTRKTVQSSQNAHLSWGEAALTKKRRRVDMEAEAKYKKDTLVEDSDDEEKYGIWGPPTQAMKALQQDQVTQLDSLDNNYDLLTPEQQKEREYIKERNRRRGIKELESETQDFDRMVERKMGHLLPPRIEGEEAVACEPSTIFHGDEEFDYKGKSWMEPPPGCDKHYDSTDVNHHTCYVPKKCVHRFTGHTKGVHRIRLFPYTGHLLLSGGLDGKCKIWSVLSQKQVMRTYIGHTAAVRDVQFNQDGTKFLSCSFDRFIRLWDTESGTVLGTFTNRRVPYVIQFYPNNNDYFVVGCSDNKIVTYDATSGKITQEYNHHLAPVNTITFCENATKMVTTSDDKKVLVWEWDIGVPIKYISDPTMHSMPVVTLHPTLKFFAGQSLDNQIVVYEAHGRFAQQRKKKFKGHICSGYACDIAISPDGRFMASGDGNGKLFFWDWRSHKILQKYNAHTKGPSVGCVWHPTLPSVMFTCGWDGVIKMWE